MHNAIHLNRISYARVHFERHQQIFDHTDMAVIGGKVQNAGSVLDEYDLTNSENDDHMHDHRLWHKYTRGFTLFYTTHNAAHLHAPVIILKTLSTWCRFTFAFSTRYLTTLTWSYSAALNKGVHPCLMLHMVWQIANTQITLWKTNTRHNCMRLVFTSNLIRLVWVRFGHFDQVFYHFEAAVPGGNEQRSQPILAEYNDTD